MRVSTLVVLALIFSTVAWADGASIPTPTLDPGPVLQHELPFDVPESWGLPGADWDPPSRTPRPTAPSSPPADRPARTGSPR